MAHKTFTPIPKTGKQSRDIVALAENIEQLMGARGDNLDSAPTWRDLLTLGFVSKQGSSRNRTFQSALPTGVNSSTEIVVEAPSLPEIVEVVASLSYALATWKQPSFGGYANTEVWRNSSDDFASAVLMGTSNAGIYADEIDYTSKHYYWIRHVNSVDDKGPIQSTAGISLTPSVRADALLAQLEDKITTGQLNEAQIFDASTFAIRSNGDASLTFVVHEGKVLMDAAYIHNLTVTSAQVENLAADKLTSFNAAFVNAKMGDGWIGNAQIGQVIESANYMPGASGWHWNKDGSFECHSGYFRGDIYSANAYVRGDIEATSIKANVVNAIDTLMIKGGAIVITASYYNASKREISYKTSSGYGGWGTVSTKAIGISHSTSTSVVLIDCAFASMSWGNYDSGESGEYWIQAELRRNGSLIRSWGADEFLGKRDSSNSKARGWYGIQDRSLLQYEDKPGDGNHTYTLQCRFYSNGDGGHFWVADSNMRLVGAKR